MKTHYEIGKLHHNGKFVGWALWKVHANCTRVCCPKTVAEFFGKSAKKNALWLKEKLEGV